MNDEKQIKCEISIPNTLNQRIQLYKFERYENS